MLLLHLTSYRFQTYFVGTTITRNNTITTSILSLTGNAGDIVEVRFGAFYPYSQYTMDGKIYYPCAMASPGIVTTDATNLIFWKL